MRYNSRTRVVITRTVEAVAAGVILTLGASACGQVVDATPSEASVSTTDPSSSATTMGIPTTPSETPTEIVVSPPSEQPAGNMPSFEGAIVDPSCSGIDWDAPVGTQGKTLKQWVTGLLDGFQYYRLDPEGTSSLTCADEVVTIHFPEGEGGGVIQSTNAV